MVASGGKNQLSRNPGAQMAFDGAETLHVAYWRGGAVTNPNGAPSFVLYRSRTAAGVWSAEEILDNSESAGQHVGGRHPSLTVAPDGTVWVAWHDHRHGTQAGNWIDNLEIYADVKTPGGSFSATDLRLTTSSAAHLGDNGYMPRIASGEDGRLSVAWFDFHDNFDVSDIFLKTSDASGAFDLGESMDAARLTDLDDRGGTPLFVTPDLAIAPDGTRHLVWTSGTGPGQDLYHAEAPVGASSVSETLLAAGVADFFDPPRVAVAPKGDVWIALGDDSAPAGENVTLWRRRSGQATFDAPVIIAEDPARQFAPVLKFDDAGMLHLAWVDERFGRHVFYGIFDPDAGALVAEIQVTTRTATWERPALALNADGEAFVLWEESLGPAQGVLWIATTEAPARVADWERYE